MSNRLASSRLRALESKFWSIRKEVSPEDDIKPTNLEKEKSHFLKLKRNGRSYSPCFQYREYSGIERINELQKIVQDAKLLDEAPVFLPLVQDLIDWIINFTGRDADFGPWLYSLHGAPPDDLVEYATEKLNENVYDPVEVSNISAPEAMQYFASILKTYTIMHWNTSLKSMPAKVAVNAQEETIFVNPEAKFTSAELSRLSVHEVGTHVLRYENGKKQESLIYRYGFPGYLECEEGLAIKSEERAGLMSGADFRKYCLRVIACSLCKDRSFEEVYDSIKTYAPEELAFSVVARVKRGLIDTSSSFGFTKDQVYLSGYRRVSQLSAADIRSLYIGKIGFNQLIELNFSEIDFSKFIIPKWWESDI